MEYIGAVGRSIAGQDSLWSRRCVSIIVVWVQLHGNIALN